MNSVTIILYLVVLVAAGYFLIFRPQQKRAKEQQALMAALKVGERVVTLGGIYGTIESVGDDTVDLTIAEGVTITIAKASIARAVAPDEETASADKPASGEVEEPHVHVDGAAHDPEAEGETSDDMAKGE